MAIAASHDSSISSAELFLLLPPGAFVSAESLEEFVVHDTSLRQDLIVCLGEIAFKDLQELARHRAEQVSLTASRMHLAQSFSERLGTICPWLRLVAVSGSTAYGRTKMRDDIDFFVVTRSNRLWITLLLALIAAKIRRMRNPASPVYCFNRIHEESHCASAFRSLQEPLFAREALNLRVLEGHAYYRALVGSAPWMENLFPALYRQALSSSTVGDTGRDDGGRRVWSIANWIAFAALTPYLTLVGLWRNVRLQKAGEYDSLFRTVIRRGFFAYESTKYDLLRDTYRRAF